MMYVCFSWLVCFTSEIIDFDFGGKYNNFCTVVKIQKIKLESASGVNIYLTQLIIDML